MAAWSDGVSYSKLWMNFGRNSSSALGAGRPFAFCWAIAVTRNHAHKHQNGR